MTQHLAMGAVPAELRVDQHVSRVAGGWQKAIILLNGVGGP